MHNRDSDFRVTIGGPACRQPHEGSPYNISAMRFGALSGNAIVALGRGPKIAGAAGLRDPRRFTPYHFMFRDGSSGFVDGTEAYPYTPNGFLLQRIEIPFGPFEKRKQA